MSVKVSEKTLSGIEDLRNLGSIQLTDLAASIKQLEEMGHYEASDWVQNNWELYEKGLREGFEVG